MAAESGPVLYLGFNTVIVGMFILMGVSLYFIIKKSFIRLVARRYLPDSFCHVLQIVVRWLIIVVVALLSLQQVGVPLSAVWATVSAIAVLVAIGFVAVWSVLSNVFCSVLLIMFPPFRMGEEIEIMDSPGAPGLRGKVDDINMFFTVLKEIKNKQVKQNVEIRIPNNMFFQKFIRRTKSPETISLNEYFSSKAVKLGIRHD